MARANDEEEYDDEDGGDEERHESLADALSRQWGAAPWYVGSFGIHMVIFAVFLLFAPDPVEKVKEKIKIEPVPIEEEVKDEPDDVQEEDTPDDPQDTPTDAPNVTADVSVTTEVSTDVSVDVDVSSDDAPTDSTDFSEADSDVAPTLGLTSVTPSAGRSAGKFASRSGKAKGGLLQKGGGSKSGAKALKSGLAWLAKTQEENGAWISTKYDGKGHHYAVTSLAILAFLGDGNSSKSGPHKRTVRAAESFLISGFKKDPGMIGVYRYEAAVTLMAMAEAWAMSEDPALEPIVKAQVAYAEKSQSTTGGWGYTATGNAAADHIDTSVAGWWVMALKSAKVAGAKVSDKCWNGAIKYFKDLTMPAGANMRGTMYKEGQKWRPSVTAVGLTCLQFLGLDVKDKFVSEQANMMLQSKLIMGNDGISPPRSVFYIWYYQALGFFQLGLRSPQWGEFKKKFEPFLLNLQDKGGFNNGSWGSKDGQGLYEGYIGRVGTTATACLMLEVYYRFDNVHSSGSKH